MPVMPCTPCAMHAKSRHHFVEDQHAPWRVHSARSPSRNPALRHHEIHVAGDRLDDDGRDLRRGSPRTRPRRAGKVVVGRDDRQLGDARRHAGGGRLSERERARARLHEQAVAVAVIAALELEDLRATRDSRARGAARTSSLRCRTTRAAPSRSTAGVARASPASSISSLGRRAERQAAHRRFLHRPHDGGMRMAEDGGSPRADVVDVALAVGVPHVGALAAREESRRSTDGAERAHGRVHAAGNRALRTREQLVVAAHGGYPCLQSTRRSRAAARVTSASVVVREHRRDHGDGVHAGIHERRRVARRDAADRHDRHAERLRRRDQRRRRRAARPGFTLRREEASECDVVGALRERAAGARSRSS